MTRITVYVFAVAVFFCESLTAGDIHLKPEQIYVLEKAEGIIIDGDERDFGVTDALHKWHPPQYIKFGSKKQMDNSGSWGGANDLSGRVALKVDEKHLYIFAEIFDDHPMTHTGNDRWKVDCMELFVSPNPHQLPTDSFSYRKGDMQIQFSAGNGENIKPSVYVLVVGEAGRKTPVGVKGCKLVAKQKQLMIDGNTGNGWIVEAKIPRSLAGVKWNSDYVGIGLTIGDSDPGKSHKKCFAAGSKQPFVSVENFLFGFIYEQKQLSSRTLELGSGPKEYSIPERFLPKNAKNKDIKIWDMSLAARKSLPGRDSICLDGVWGVQTFGMEMPERIDDGKWMYLATPIDPLFYRSFWTPPAYFGVKDGRLKLNSNFDKELKRQQSRIFSRKITVPENWKGGRIYLDIANRGTMVKCKVFWNNKLISGPEGDASTMLDVTDHVDFRKSNMVTILASANTHKKSGRRTLSVGDIWLHRTAKQATLQSIYLKPSVSKKSITVDFEVDSHTDISDLQVEVEFRDSKKEKRRHVIPAKALTECRTERSNLYRITYPWATPKLWSPNHPHLYFAYLKLKTADGKPVDCLKERFGFRETQIKGKELLINGIPVHLRAAHAGSVNHALFYDHFRALKKRGYNCVVTFNVPVPSYINNWLDELGMYYVQDVMPYYLASLRTCDRSEDRARWLKAHRNHPSSLFWLISQQHMGKEAGWVQMNYHTLGTRYYPLKGEQGRFAYNENIKTMDWADKITPTIPSILYCSGNQGPVSSAMTHTEIGMPLQEAAGGAETWAKTDDARPLFLLESWAAAGTGNNVNLFRSSYRHVSNCWKHASRRGADNSLNAEQLSQYLGDTAYEWVSPIRTYQEYGNPVYPMMQEIDCKVESLITPSGKWWFKNRDKTNIALHAIGIREHARSDRAYGLTGRNWFSKEFKMQFQSKECDRQFNDYRGWYLPLNNMRYRRKRMTSRNRISVVDEDAVPDFLNAGKEIKDIASKRPRPFKEYFDDATRQVLVYIGGGPTQDKFRYKDHAFTSGETLVKHLVVINDLEAELALAVKWELKSVAGDVIAKGDFLNKTLPGRVTKTPLEIVVPTVENRTDCVLSVTAKNTKSGEIYKDDFSVELFPVLESQKNLKVACYDTQGDTTGLLSRLGITIETFKPDDLQENNTVVVGRNSFAEFLKEVKPSVLSDHIKNGLMLVVMEQKQHSVLGPWQQELRLRNQFIKMPHHPILEGFRDKDFTNWRGVSTLTESHPKWESASEYMNYTLHQEFGKWGNEGIVSTLPLRRQQHGNARTLLAGGFDQEWAALSELHYGKGLVLLNQMDITGRSVVDPVADRLTVRIIKYATHFKPEGYGALAYCGSEDAKQWLLRLNADITADAAGAELLVADGTGKQVDVKQYWMENLVKKEGKTLLVLWPNHESNLTWLDANMGTDEMYRRYSSYFKKNLAWIGSSVGLKLLPDRFHAHYKCLLSKEDKAEPVLKGITTEDLYYKFYREEIPLVGRVPDKGKIWGNGLIAQFPAGKGRVVLCQINPAQHKGFRSYKKAIRCLANLLTNNNVRLNCPLTFSAPPLELSQKPWQFKTDPKNTGLHSGWEKEAFDDSGWRTLNVGKSWESQGVREENPSCNNPTNTSYNGCAWYRTCVELTEEMYKNGMFLEIGAIAGYDEVWVNGKKIGPSKRLMALEGTRRQYRKWYRNYPVADGLLKSGKNTIAIKVNNQCGFGGVSKWPVRIMCKDQPNKTPLFPMEKDQRVGDPYRFFYW